MNSIIYGIACILFISSPVILIAGLIKPGIFSKLSKKEQTRRKAFVYALLIFIISLTLAGIFEPTSVRQEREAKQQLASQQAMEQTAQKQKLAPIESTKPAKAASATTTTPVITALEKQDDGYIISGKGTTGQVVEVRTIDHKKYKTTVGNDGEFRSETIKGLKPYGTLSVFTLKKSFLSTHAHYDTTAYYNLFSSQPQLSKNKQDAVVTAVSDNRTNLELRGFYLPDTSLKLNYGDWTYSEAKTNKDGYFIFRSVRTDADTMQYSIKDGTSSVANPIIYVPQKLLLKEKPVEKTELQDQAVPFQSISQDDTTLAKGRVVTSTVGQNGVRTLSYHVTYINGKEVARRQVSNTITRQPINEVKKVGTYVYVAPPTPVYVPSPAVNSNGATARCRDGTLSYSQHRRGTCSHHGGVSVWY